MPTLIPGENDSAKCRWTKRVRTNAKPCPVLDVKLKQAQEVKLLQMALAGLPLESKEVLVLSRFQNLKYEEIAGILDCGVGAVKMRVHRALKELREKFAQLAG